MFLMKLQYLFLNNIAVFIEQKFYSKTELLLSFSEEELFILASKGIIFIDNNSCKFTFVGVVSIRNFAFSIIPKLYVLTTLDDIRITVKTLKKYSNKNSHLNDGIDFFSVEPDNPECSELAIAEFLLDDFPNNGIYFERQKLYEINANGTINWGSTIDEIDPIYSSGQPIYTDTINQIIIEDTLNLTASIHKWSLNYVSEKYSALLDTDDITFDFDYEENLNELGSTEQLINHLQKLLQIIYIDREIYLIKSLIFLLKNKAGNLANDFSLYGTKAYANVWEDICRKVLNEKQSFNSFFPNPTWNILGSIFQSSSTMIPDIIITDSEENTYLFDAKYYNLQFKTGLSGEPGYKDILKQFQYQQHIESKLEKSIANFFVFPINDDQFKELKNNHDVVLIGDVLLAGNIEYKLYPNKKIFIIMIPFKKWQLIYLENIFFDCLLFKDLIY